jgi:hypothetical protein
LQFRLGDADVEGIRRGAGASQGRAQKPPGTHTGSGVQRDRDPDEARTARLSGQKGRPSRPRLSESYLGRITVAERPVDRSGYRVRILRVTTG